MRPKSSDASASLTWGLIASIGGLLFILPGLLGIGAIITGNRAKREIAASAGRLDGSSDANTGVVLGWVGIGVFALWTLLGIGFFLFILAIVGAVSTAAVT